MAAEHKPNKYTKRQFLSLGLFVSASTLAAVCAPHTPNSPITPYANHVDTKIKPAVYPKQILEDPTLTPHEAMAADLQRADFLTVLREFLNDFYLTQGVYLREDGPGYWGRHFKHRSIGEDRLYIINHTAHMGPYGQMFTVNNYYDEDDLLTKSVLVPGNVPSLISPDQLPREVPGMKHLRIPRESMKEIAEMVFDLPPNLRWRISYETRTGYMAPPPEEEFMKLAAFGKTRDGRPIEFRMDEQTFTSLLVNQRPLRAKTILA